MKLMIVGLGSIGQRHARNIRQIYGDKFDLIAVRSSPNKPLVINEGMVVERDVTPEERYKITSYKDIDEALKEKPDAALITNPTSLHMEAAIKAAKGGCSLFLEKPISHNYDQVEELAKIVEKKKLKVLVGYQLRFHPALKKIKDALQSNLIGEVTSARLEFGEFLPGAHPYEDYRKGYAAREDLGGGAILCLIHEIDGMLQLFGMPKKVFGIGGKLSDLEMTAEDTADLLFECFNRNKKEIPVHIHLDFVQRPPHRSWHIVGDRGKISWDYIQNSLRIYDAEKKSWEEVVFPGFERNHMFLDETKHFVSCLQGEQEPVATLEQGIQGLKVALAAKKSIRDKQPQNI